VAEVDPRDAPRPEVVAARKLRISKIWIVPIVAVLVAVSLFFQRLAGEGPEVTITFKSVQGIEAGKTPIRYKDVVIGTVTALRFSPDYGTVEVTARMTHEAAPLMTAGSTFWIVRPRVSMGEISGLGTLFSGNYIAFGRGDADRPARRFTGLEDARIVDAGTPGRQFALHSHESLRVDAGLPIYYLGLLVGQVISVGVRPDGHGVDVQAFVNAPYDRYVRASTRFWNADGIDLRTQGGDVVVRTESLTALLVGGIAFDNLPSTNDEAPANAGSAFTLYRDRATALKPHDAHQQRYVLLFSEPVDGVQPGSAVKLLGVEAGEVTAVGLEFDEKSRRLRGRVEVAISLERLLERLPQAQLERGESQADAYLRRMVMSDGLRGQLRTASLVTGQRYVAFDYFPRASAVRVDWTAKHPQLPVVPSVLPAFEEKLAAILDKVDALPMKETIADARGMMQDARLAFASVHDLAQDVDQKALPGFVATMNNARSALDSAQRMLDGAATLVGEDAPAQRELRAALQEITRAARAFRTLSDSIERHPESVLWGREARSMSP